MLLRVSPHMLPPRVWFRDRFFVSSYFCPVLKKKVDFWMSDSMSNLATFFEMLKIRRTFVRENSHKIRKFLIFFCFRWWIKIRWWMILFHLCYNFTLFGFSEMPEGADFLSVFSKKCSFLSCETSILPLELRV